MKKVLTEHGEYLVYHFDERSNSIVFSPVDLVPEEAVEIFRKTNSLKLYDNDVLSKEFGKVVFVSASYDHRHNILEIAMRTPNETEQKVDELSGTSINVEDAICELYEMINALKEGK